MVLGKILQGVLRSVMGERLQEKGRHRMQPKAAEGA